MLPEPDILEATVPPAIHRKTPDWLALYRRDLPFEVHDEMWDLPTVSAAQTLLDCAAVLPCDDAARLIDDNVGRTVAARDILELCRAGRRGSPAARKQLGEAAIHAASEPERLFARALARRHVHLLPNHPIGPYVCDLVDERSRTIVEIDGREFHSEPGVFRRDRRRQNRLLLDRWLILRYAAADVYTALDACADEVAAVVRRRRASRPG
ncbi:DUF559 domain-containing protein [Nocardia sp. NPDC050710]|uniref:DUF559 domain-containing protein n=1 Tax=Nocardia sp. NPDC050710 TaxID=3157220 RepID=UPI0033E7083F